jgi:hypothetical protein
MGEVTLTLFFFIFLLHRATNEFIKGIKGPTKEIVKKMTEKY